MVEGSAVWADLTVAFGAVKVGSVLLPGAEHSGTVRVVDIGFPDDLVRPSIGLVEPADVAAVLPVRSTEGHKRSSGVLLVVAGSRRMTGAPALVARAAGRVGAGLVIVAAPEMPCSAVQAHATEAVFLPLAQTDDGTVALGALDALLEAAGEPTPSRSARGCPATTRRRGSFEPWSAAPRRRSCSTPTG